MINNLHILLLMFIGFSTLLYVMIRLNRKVNKMIVSSAIKTHEHECPLRQAEKVDKTEETVVVKLLGGNNETTDK